MEIYHEIEEEKIKIEVIKHLKTHHEFIMQRTPKM